MQLITVKELFRNFGRYMNKYTYVEGYYFDGILYNDKDKDETEKIISPQHSRLSIFYYLNALKRDTYEGRLRIVGMPGDRLYVVKNINRIVKIELLDADGKIIDSFVNEEIPLPKELRGKL